MGNYLSNHVLRNSKRACFDYSMIDKDDRILACFSGGKDSFALICALDMLNKKIKDKFYFKILCIDPGFDKDFSINIDKVLSGIGFDYEIIKSNIKGIILEQDKNGKLNRCFMCSRLRRGIIYDYAVKFGFNTVALGHNLDDAIENTLLNTFFSYKTSFMKPKYYADKYPIKIIRPLIYIEEQQIEKYVKLINYLPIKNNCPLKTDDSKRLFFKNMITQLKKNHPKVTESAMNSFKNIVEINKWN